MRVGIAVLALGVAACTDGSGALVASDAGGASEVPDAASPDAGHADAGAVIDAAVPDLGSADAGVVEVPCTEGVQVHLAQDVSDISVGTTDIATLGNDVYALGNGPAGPTLWRFDSLLREIEPTEIALEAGSFRQQLHRHRDQLDMLLTGFTDRSEEVVRVPDVLGAGGPRETVRVPRGERMRAMAAFDGAPVFVSEQVGDATTVLSVHSSDVVARHPVVTDRVRFIGLYPEAGFVSYVVQEGLRVWSAAFPTLERGLGAWPSETCSNDDRPWSHAARARGDAVFEVVACPGEALLTRRSRTGEIEARTRLAFDGAGGLSVALRLDARGDVVLAAWPFGAGAPRIHVFDANLESRRNPIGFGMARFAPSGYVALTVSDTEPGVYAVAITEIIGHGAGDLSVGRIRLCD